MDKIINQSIANGTVKVPPSKSMAHRYIICAGLSDGVSTISNVDYSEDIKATIDCIKALGVKVETKDSVVVIDPSQSILKELKKTYSGAKENDISDKTDISEIDFLCRESGSTMRFFMGIAMSLPFVSNFYGSETLRNRPFGIYEDILNNTQEDEKNNGRFMKTEDKIVIQGGIKENNFEIAGNISSQFVTGLLLALSLKEEGGRIALIPPIESRSYINMTIQAMREFGIDVDWESDNVLCVKENQTYIARDIEVEGDYSNAAFLDAFNFLGGNVKVEGLNPKSLQGDKVYLDCFEKLKAGKAVIDIADCPDLGPVLFSVAAANHGGIFTSTARLKIKESDRGSVMCEELAKLGVKTRMDDNSIEIEGNGISSPSERLSGHNDHRIVMSLSLLLTIVGGTITQAEAVRKSYPGFFEDIKSLGIKVKDI
ncbi:MAG: 3-phosphoshikimate 1-carboxyvinyltransferase [Lachnospiraceae bacterium]|nr:3-phosphoshikimate 1-carboxyvinyltransferase [Lachnospiraceae bacterium]